MRNALIYLIGLCIALWLGGLMMLFITLMSVFAADHALGAQVGPILFGKLEPYQLALAAIALTCTIAWRLMACSRAKKMMLACLLGATILSMASFAYVTPQLIDMWGQKQLLGQQAMIAAFEGTTQPTQQFDQERFNKLHQTSRWLYTGAAVLVLLAGGAFIAAVRLEPPPPSTQRGFEV